MNGIGFIHAPLMITGIIVHTTYRIGMLASYGRSRNGGGHRICSGRLLLRTACSAGREQSKRKGNSR